MQFCRYEAAGEQIKNDISFVFFTVLGSLTLAVFFFTFWLCCDKRKEAKRTKALAAMRE